ncbi:hypothetical protein NL676_008764 [Syzygium grande]|nr:hypothetical protein NL676_008764 [Syzygium grande]
MDLKTCSQSAITCSPQIDPHHHRDASIMRFIVTVTFVVGNSLTFVPTLILRRDLLTFKAVHCLTKKKVVHHARLRIRFCFPADDRRKVLHEWSANLKPPVTTTAPTWGRYCSSATPLPPSLRRPSAQPSPPRAATATTAVAPPVLRTSSGRRKLVSAVLSGALSLGLLFSPLSITAESPLAGTTKSGPLVEYCRKEEAKEDDGGGRRARASDE